MSTSVSVESRSKRATSITRHRGGEKRNGYYGNHALFLAVLFRFPSWSMAVPGPVLRVDLSVCVCVYVCVCVCEREKESVSECLCV